MCDRHRRNRCARTLAVAQQQPQESIRQKFCGVPASAHVSFDSLFFNSQRQTKLLQRPNPKQGAMAPLILHNVPDDECYIGEDGIKRPYAMIFDRYGSHSRYLSSPPRFLLTKCPDRTDPRVALVHDAPLLNLAPLVNRRDARDPAQALPRGGAKTQPSPLPTSSLATGCPTSRRQPQRSRIVTPRHSRMRPSHPSSPPNSSNSRHSSSKSVPSQPKLSYGAIAPRHNNTPPSLTLSPSPEPSSRTIPASHLLPSVGTSLRCATRPLRVGGLYLATSWPW